VATIFRGQEKVRGGLIFFAMGKTAVFTGNFSDFKFLQLRGTRVAKGPAAMNAIAEISQNIGCEPALSSDWVETHSDYLFNFAIGQVRDAGVAEDLVQETFLAALKSQNGFSGRSSERTWLVGILRHKICDHLRKTCRERARRVDCASATGETSGEDSMLWLHDVAAESQSPDRRIELHEFRENLELALGKLPPRIAQVFQLYEIEERPNNEVCMGLNISESNLWVMLHRARKQLREELRCWWSAEPAEKIPENRINF
jgi:RNA polymerase sigma-70 factor (ECF subfamily)